MKVHLIIPLMQKIHIIIRKILSKYSLFAFAKIFSKHLQHYFRLPILSNAIGIFLLSTPDTKYFHNTIALFVRRKNLCERIKFLQNYLH